MNQDDALALDDAHIEDSVSCEGCGETFDVTDVVLSVFEADDGGSYCAECAAKEWALVVEENDRLRTALAFYADRDSYRYAYVAGPWTAKEFPVLADAGQRARAALASADGSAR